MEVQLVGRKEDGSEPLSLVITVQRRLLSEIVAQLPEEHYLGFGELATSGRKHEVALDARGPNRICDAP